MHSKYDLIVQYLRTFEAHLDDEHEIAIQFAQYTGTFSLLLTRGGCDDFILFELADNEDNTFAIVQNYSQLNFAIMSLPKKNPDMPAKRIGF